MLPFLSEEGQFVNMMLMAAYFFARQSRSVQAVYTSETNQMSSQNRRVTILALIVVLPMLMAGLIFSRALPAFASCGGTTNVANETQLNAAITDFNSCTANTFTINVTADITLTADLTTISNSDSTAELIIEGNGHTLDGDETFKTIVADSSGAAPVTVSGLTVSGSKEYGISANVPITIEDSVLAGNSINGLNAYGGATIRGTTIRTNGVNGIFGSNHDITITDSTISNNRSIGINISSISLTVINSTLSDNNSYGIFTNLSTVTITNSAVVATIITVCISATAPI
ncbi:MAG: right-handed parallel beta-helix repeat-containing protein [Chloroflexota bacterium]